jgi:hypothetical protein
MPTLANDELLRPAEAARCVNGRRYPCVSSSVYRWIYQGRLPATPMGPRDNKRLVF